jgi:hypothetical protein
MDRNEWKRVVREGVETTNECEESREKKQKDERKCRREGRQMISEAALKCDQPECEFMALNKAGLANHTRQKHQHPQFAHAMCASSQNISLPRSSQSSTFLR